MHPLRTELLNEYAHFVGFLPVLPVVPCLCARWRWLLHLKISSSHFVWLSLTSVGSIHQNFGDLLLAACLPNL